MNFGTDVDMHVLNLNPRIRIEILWRFHKIQDDGQDGRQTHIFTSDMATVIIFVSKLKFWESINPKKYF